MNVVQALEFGKHGITVNTYAPGGFFLLQPSVVILTYMRMNRWRHHPHEFALLIYHFKPMTYLVVLAEQFAPLAGLTQEAFFAAVSPIRFQPSLSKTDCFY
jgi:NAD(P)-dependent dehydrogenase (short-subunit alcohol dehydrogenase family)